MGGKRLPPDYLIISEARHRELTETPFNPAVNGLESESKFSNAFAHELSEVMTQISAFYGRHGVYGSVDRAEKKMPSDWWIDSDFYSTSRVLCVDLLNPKLQTLPIIEGVQVELRTLHDEWMVCAGHRNACDDKGQFTGEPGEYYFWITKGKVEIYSERKKDLRNFLESLPERGRIR